MIPPLRRCKRRPRPWTTAHLCVRCNGPSVLSVAHRPVLNLTLTCLYATGVSIGLLPDERSTRPHNKVFGHFCIRLYLVVSGQTIDSCDIEGLLSIVSLTHLFPTQHRSGRICMHRSSLPLTVGVGRIRWKRSPMPTRAYHCCSNAKAYPTQ